MEIIKGIDLFLQNIVVRWALLIFLTISVVSTIWFRTQLGVVRLQRDAADGQAATYRAHLEVQNAAVIEQGKEFKRVQDRIYKATLQVDHLQKKLATRKVEVREVVLNGPCENMVQTVLDEVRK